MDLNLIGRLKLVLIGYLQTKLTVAASTWGSHQFSGLRQAMSSEGLSSLDRWPRVLINNKTDCENDGTETHKAFKKLNYQFLQEWNKESTFLLLHVRNTFNIKPHVYRFFCTLITLYYLQLPSNYDLSIQRFTVIYCLCIYI